MLNVQQCCSVLTSHKMVALAIINSMREETVEGSKSGEESGPSASLCMGL